MSWRFWALFNCKFGRHFYSLLFYFLLKGVTIRFLPLVLGLRVLRPLNWEMRVVFIILLYSCFSRTFFICFLFFLKDQMAFEIVENFSFFSFFFFWSFNLVFFLSIMSLFLQFEQN